MATRTWMLVCVLLASAHCAPQEASERRGASESKSVLSSLQSFLGGLYREFANRRQSFANLLACGNCVNDGWDAIMTAVANVPGLEWSYKPEANDHPPNFFTALNQNGVVTGFGGSIVGNKPVIEFVFDRDGIIHQLNVTNSSILKN